MIGFFQGSGLRKEKCWMIYHLLCLRQMGIFFVRIQTLIITFFINIMVVADTELLFIAFAIIKLFPFLFGEIGFWFMSWARVSLERMVVAVGNAYRLSLN